MESIRTASLLELLVGATQHSPPADRRFQDLKQKPISQLGDGAARCPPRLQVKNYGLCEMRADLVREPSIRQALSRLALNGEPPVFSFNPRRGFALS